MWIIFYNNRKFKRCDQSQLLKGDIPLGNGKCRLGLTPEITAVHCIVVYKKGGEVVKVIRGGNLEELTYTLPSI